MLRGERMYPRRIRARIFAFVVCLLCLPSMQQVAFGMEPPDACSLLSTQRKLPRASAVEVDVGTAIAAGSCRWNGAGEAARRRCRDATDQFHEAAIIRDRQAPLSGYTKSPEPGIGDDAYSVVGGGVVTFSVKKGSAVIIILSTSPKLLPRANQGRGEEAGAQAGRKLRMLRAKLAWVTITEGLCASSGWFLS